MIVVFMPKWEEMIEMIETYANIYIPLSAPDISVYATHCINRRRHTKRRMRQYYASTNPDANGNRKIKSTWDRRIGEIPPVRDAGFSSKGTTVFDMPKDYSRSGNRIYDDSIAKLNKAGIGVGRWYDDKYMVTKKPRVRTSKWLEGTSKD